MPIVEFEEIKVGRDSNIFKKFKLKLGEEHRRDLSFTIYAKKRTLDCEAASQLEMERFIVMLRVVMAQLKQEDEEAEAAAAAAKDEEASANEAAVENPQSVVSTLFPNLLDGDGADNSGGAPGHFGEAPSEIPRSRR